MQKKAVSRRQRAVRSSSVWLKTLYEIAREVNSNLTLTHCLKTIAGKAVRLLKVERASLMLLDPARKELTIAYATGLPPSVIRKSRIRVGQGVSGWVAKTGRPLLIQDIRKDRRFRLLAGGKYHTHSLLSVPLKAKGHLIGVFNVNNKKGRKTFTRQDLQLLSALANEAAIALDNSRLYEALLSANERLRGLDRMKSAFLANASHELRTPLATMRYFTSILLGAPEKLTGTQRGYLQVMEENVDRLTRLIDNLLNLSRIESGRLQLKRERSDLGELVRTSIETVHRRAEGKRIAIQTELPPKPLFLYVDPDRLTEVVINLLDNAVKFTPEGKRIDVAAGVDLGKAFVRVRDEGIGISKEERERIFDRFRQGSQPTSSRRKGLGLGLAIAKEIVLLHEGEISVESAPGEGASFTVSLPLYEEEEFFMIRLGEELRKARRGESSLSLLIVEIREFAELCRRFGEGKGRELLERVEGCVRRTVRRPSDLVASYKRGEIITVLAGTDRRGIAALTRRLKGAFQEEKASWEAEELSVEFGSATYPEDGATARELWEKAGRSLKRGSHVRG